MAYDEQTAARFRFALGKRKGLSEKRMMGGICFLINGNMVGGVDKTKAGASRFMFRVGKDNDAVAAQLSGAQPMVQGGRRMTGFFFVDEATCDDATLRDWLKLALAFVETLPAK